MPGHANGKPIIFLKYCLNFEIRVGFTHFWVKLLCVCIFRKNNNLNIFNRFWLRLEVTICFFGNMAPKNVSSWRLNKAETAELEQRVAAGEDESKVKRELQEKKAQANEDRKAAAQAVSQKCHLPAQALAKAKAGPKAAAMAAAAAQSNPPGNGTDELNDAANKSYYCQVQCDIRAILAEFGGEAFRQELPLPITGAKDSGVQDPFCRTKALHALDANACYRCSISIWWVSALQSPTPGVPMSRRRVVDLSEFTFGATGEAKFHSDKMLEIAVSRSDLDTDKPNGLQLVSPRATLHAAFCGCARAIQTCGFSILIFIVF